MSWIFPVFFLYFSDFLQPFPMIKKNFWKFLVFKVSSRRLKFSQIRYFHKKKWPYTAHKYINNIFRTLISKTMNTNPPWITRKIIIIFFFTQEKVGKGWGVKANHKVALIVSYLLSAGAPPLFSPPHEPSSRDNDMVCESRISREKVREQQTKYLNNTHTHFSLCSLYAGFFSARVFFWALRASLEEARRDDVTSRIITMWPDGSRERERLTASLEIFFLYIFVIIFILLYFFLFFFKL